MHLPAADAGVGVVAHAAPGVAVVLEQAAGEKHIRLGSLEHARLPPHLRTLSPGRLLLWPQEARAPQRVCVELREEPRGSGLRELASLAAPGLPCLPGH